MKTLGITKVFDISRHFAKPPLMVTLVFLSASNAVRARCVDAGEISRPIYYLSISIERGKGPFLKQIIGRMDDIPENYQSRGYYRGMTWQVLTNRLLTKSDSRNRKDGQVTEVIIPLPAGCFLKNFDAGQRAACIENPQNVADGYIQFETFEIPQKSTISEILESRKILKLPTVHASYYRGRWIDVVLNFNPIFKDLTSIPAGSPLVIPLLSQASNEPRVNAGGWVVADGQHGENCETVPPKISSRANTRSETEVLPFNKDDHLDQQDINDTKSPAMASEKSNIDTQEKLRSPKITPDVITREHKNKLGLFLTRNISVSDKAALLSDQQYYDLKYRRAVTREFEMSLGLEHGARVSGKSHSQLLLPADDASEHFTYSAIDIGSNLILPIHQQKLKVQIGYYLRATAMDIRYYVDSPSDEVAYLAEKKSSKNLVFGFSAGIEADKYSLRHRFAVHKDVYEITNDSLMNDRTRIQWTTSKYMPWSNSGMFRVVHVDGLLGLESSKLTIDQDSNELEITFRRAMFGLGLGSQW